MSPVDRIETFLSNAAGHGDELPEPITRKEIYLKEICERIAAGVTPESWADVQKIVRAGMASKIFSIGDQLTCQRDGIDLVWDIIGIDHDIPADPQYTHSLTLQLHDCFPTSMQFDAREAFYYAETEMPAGTYHFKLAAHTWVAADVGKSFQFTLTQAVPAGGQIVFIQANNQTLVNAGVNTFASATAENAIETVTMTVGTGGTGMGDLDNTVQTNMNSCQRALIGSNNYKESAIRQWLNSDKAAGSVWVPQTKFDRPPSSASNTAGWENDLDSDFLAVLGKTHIVVSRNTVTDGGGYDEMDDYFFLLSRREAYMGNEVGDVIEGEPYPYYSDYSDLSAAGERADSNRIKHRDGATSSWWLRTPNAGTNGYARSVYGSGAMGIDWANSALGVAPACNII